MEVVVAVQSGTLLHAHFHSASRVFRMSVYFLPMVHADCKLRRANRLRIQAAKKPQLKRM